MTAPDVKAVIEAADDLLKALDRDDRYTLALADAIEPFQRAETGEPEDLSSEANGVADLLADKLYEWLDGNGEYVDESYRPGNWVFHGPPPANEIARFIRTTIAAPDGEPASKEGEARV